MLKHLQPTAQPIDEHDDFIDGAIKQISPPALLMSVVHMTGDTSLLRDELRPKVMDVVEASTQTERLYEGGYTKQQVEAIREKALEAIRDYRDRGCTLPDLSDATIDKMLDFVSGYHLDDDYRDFIREEIAFDGIDHRGLQLDDSALRERAAGFPVVIIGAGMGGVLAAIRLKEAGIPCTVIEKNDAIGGTWLENRYPGCRVDVPGHSYSYSFEPNHHWSSYYPLAEEIHRYYEHCADEYDVRRLIRFKTEVKSAVYDDKRCRWSVHVEDAEGREETLEACAVISAVGQLNRPRLPDIPGLDRFQGQLLHSAAWQGSRELRGKRVAVIGSGASAFQIIPELAKTAEQLTVFQRSPAWMFPNPLYHRHVPEGQQWALEKLPFYSKWYRFWLFYTSIEGVFDKTQVDPAWQKAGAVSAANDAMREVLTGWIKSQVKDEELLKKVLPTYPPFGKRILQDNGSYLSALQQPHVELVTTGIEAINETGVITRDGRQHDVDVIVCATGFHADRFLYPMEIRGLHGIDLNAQWQGTDCRAYLGITVPNFPNLFCIYGPNTNLVVAGSIAHNAESQVSYILQCLRLLFETGVAAMDCRQSVHDEYNRRVDAANAGAAWGWEGVNNWYKNDRGRVTANLPFRIIDYWRMTHRVNPDDFQFYQPEQA